MKKNILIVDDDKRLRELLKDYLTEKNLQVYQSEDYNEAKEILSLVLFDLIILDRMMPSGDGIELINHIKQFSNTPVIMLTAKGEEDDLISGFDTGADDYLVKPFSPKELIARIKALLRRTSERTTSSKLSYANIVMDTDMHRVYCCDKETKLGPREYRILEFFMQNPGRVYTRQQILDAVWGTNVYITDRTIDVHIRRLRKALSTTEECKVIRTIRSSGYSLDSEN